MEITNNINLGELSEQVGHANLIITCLPECDGDHDSSKEVSDGAAEVCVLAYAPGGSGGQEKVPSMNRDASIKAIAPHLFLMTSISTVKHAVLEEN